MSHLRSYLLPLAIALPMAGLTYGLGYTVGQSGFARIIGLYAPLFLLYLLAWRVAHSGQRVVFFLGLGVALRVLLLFYMPALSDDVYRFIWDGRLLAQGINPFDRLPGYYLEEGRRVPGLTEELFRELNSPEYFTVYPPVAQATFAVAAWLFPLSLAGSVLVMKLFLLACELGSLALLWRLLPGHGRPRRDLLLYALNPLIVVEVMGNLHYEGAMIFFLLLSYYWLRQNNLPASAVAMALSIGVKLLPLMFLPFLLRRLRRRGSLIFFGLTGGVLLLLFLPLLNGVFLSNFGQSIDLYFRRFEFNASVYYVWRWIGYQQVGYNLIFRIGPRLAMLTAAGITLFALLERDRRPEALPGRWLFAIVLYLFLTTTVHPWYTALPVVLCLFTPFRFPILWSGLIFLTYINYSYEPYRENLWIVALEYGAVGGFMAWELWKRRREWEVPEFLKNGVKKFRLIIFRGEKTK